MIMPYRRSFNGTSESSLRKLVEPSVLAPPARQACSEMCTLSSMWILPALSSAATTYSVMILVSEAGARRASMLLDARIWPLAKSISTHACAFGCGAGGIGVCGIVGTGLGGVDGFGGNGVVWANRAPVNATRKTNIRGRTIFIDSLCLCDRP